MIEFVRLEEYISKHRKSIISGPFGSNISSKFFVETGVPVIRGNNLTFGTRKFIDDGFVFISEEKAEELDCYALPDDIIFTAAGTIGQVGIITKGLKYSSYTISNKQIRVRLDKNKIDVNFAYLILSSPFVRNQIIKGNTGSTIPLINLLTVKNLLLPRIDKREQQKITAVLSALDDKIELNNKINAELEQIAKTLYDYWFVQFDFPNERGKPYKSSGGSMIYNTELGRKVPEGWQQELVNDLGTIIGGSTPSRTVEEYFTDIGIPWITPKDLSLNRGNKFITRGDSDITEKGFKAASLSFLPAKSVLMSSRAPIGYLAINTVDCTTNQGIKSIFCNKTYSHEYVYYVLKNYMPIIEANATGSTFKEISAGVFKSIKIIKPKYEIVKKFVEQVKSIFDRQANLEKQNYQLAMLRDWLLPMLMNGQAKVLDDYDSSEEKINTAFELTPEYQKETQLNIPSNRKGFAKQVLAGRIISLFKNDPHFTDIKFQKIQFLAEHIIQADLNLNYYYQAAGPYDNVFMHTIYNDLKKNKWYDCKDRKFTALEKQIKIEEYYQNYFGPATGQLDKLFRLLLGTTEAKSEIIATIYAVWNNFIIEGKPVDDDELIQSFYNWSERKHQYTEAQVIEGLQWLRENKLEPTGFGKLIKKAKRKK